MKKSFVFLLTMVMILGVSLSASAAESSKTDYVKSGSSSNWKNPISISRPDGSGGKFNWNFGDIFGGNSGNNGGNTEEGNDGNEETGGGNQGDNTGGSGSSDAKEPVKECPAPTNVKVASEMSMNVRKMLVSWDRVKEADQYIIQRSTSEDFSSDLLTDTTKDTRVMYSMSGPSWLYYPARLTYYFRVKAVAGQTESNWSEVIVSEGGPIVP